VHAFSRQVINELRRDDDVDIRYKRVRVIKQVMNELTRYDSVFNLIYESVLVSEQVTNELSTNNNDFIRYKGVCV